MLLNDLFGIQSRGGCSCAGPYGIDLLKLNNTCIIGRFQKEVIIQKNSIMKPGYTRLNIHWLFAKYELLYLILAIKFVSLHAYS